MSDSSPAATAALQELLTSGKLQQSLKPKISKDITTALHGALLAFLISRVSSTDPGIKDSLSKFFALWEQSVLDQVRAQANTFIPEGQSISPALQEELINQYLGAHKEIIEGLVANFSKLIK